MLHGVLLFYGNFPPTFGLGMLLKAARRSVRPGSRQKSQVPTLPSSSTCIAWKISTCYFSVMAVASFGPSKKFFLVIHYFFVLFLHLLPNILDYFS